MSEWARPCQLLEQQCGVFRSMYKLGWPKFSAVFPIPRSRPHGRTERQTQGDSLHLERGTGPVRTLHVCRYLDRRKQAFQRVNLSPQKPVVARIRRRAASGSWQIVGTCHALTEPSAIGSRLFVVSACATVIPNASGPVTPRGKHNETLPLVPFQQLPPSGVHRRPGPGTVTISGTPTLGSGPRMTGLIAGQLQSRDVDPRLPPASAGCTCRRTRHTWRRSTPAHPAARAMAR
jgi:hypothetical protein